MSFEKCSTASNSLAIAMQKEKIIGYGRKKHSSGWYMYRRMCTIYCTFSIRRRNFLCFVWQRKSWKVKKKRNYEHDEYERERERERERRVKQKTKRTMLILFVWKNRVVRRSSRLPARADFTNKLFNRCNIPCKYSVSRLDDVTFPSGRKSYLVISRESPWRVTSRRWARASNWTLSSDRFLLVRKRWTFLFSSIY